jgi:glycosyltransferase involved in cell wall biosynthesis
MRYSVIVPVYNRPQEVRELLQSLAGQAFGDFEVIVVEDGSQHRCEHEVSAFRDRLRVRYIYKENSGPGPSRNAGFAKAQGEYLVVFDSDCTLPPTYFTSVEEFIRSHPVDAWGGPDRASGDFTPVQRAVAYTMSSVLTTGGIRGGRGAGFQPRSFNMGMSRTVYETTGGFRFDRLAEDIELSIRIRNLGFRTWLIPDAYVYHRRRTSLGAFFRQAFAFGRGRVQVGRVHEKAVRPVHWLPALFCLGGVVTAVLLVALPPAGRVALGALLTYLGSVFFHSLAANRHLLTALLSVPAAVVQLAGYGLGFCTERLRPADSR